MHAGMMGSERIASCLLSHLGSPYISIPNLRVALVHVRPCCMYWLQEHRWCLSLACHAGTWAKRHFAFLDLGWALLASQYLLSRTAWIACKLGWSHSRSLAHDAYDQFLKPIGPGFINTHTHTRHIYLAIMHIWLHVAS